MQFFKFSPITAFGLWGSGHNILKLMKILMVLELKKLLEERNGVEVDKENRKRMK